MFLIPKATVTINVSSAPIVFYTTTQQYVSVQVNYVFFSLVYITCLAVYLPNLAFINCRKNDENTVLTAISLYSSKDKQRLHGDSCLSLV